MSNSFKIEDFMKLVQQLTDQQYGQTTNHDNIAWSPSGPDDYVKNKIKSATSNGLIDLTNVKSDKLQEEILKAHNVKIGNFKIRITKNYLNNKKYDFDLVVWEERHKTPNGMPCRIDCAMIFENDSRFNKTSWVKLFDGSNCASNITIEQFVEIIRWLQIASKLSAFV